MNNNIEEEAILENQKTISFEDKKKLLLFLQMGMHEGSFKNRSLITKLKRDIARQKTSALVNEREK